MYACIPQPKNHATYWKTKSNRRQTHTCIHIQAETIAKINMVGSYDAAIKKMEADGIPRSSLPEFMGGGSKGIKTVEYVSQLIQVIDSFTL
jgi:hypothetical protein